LLEFALHRLGFLDAAQGVITTITTTTTTTTTTIKNFKTPKPNNPKKGRAQHITATAIVDVNDGSQPSAADPTMSSGGRAPFVTESSDMDVDITTTTNSSTSSSTTTIAITIATTTSTSTSTSTISTTSTTNTTNTNTTTTTSTGKRVAVMEEDSGRGDVKKAKAERVEGSSDTVMQDLQASSVQEAQKKYGHTLDGDDDDDINNGDFNRCVVARTRCLLLT
jgi:hypothetical protein